MAYFGSGGRSDDLRATRGPASVVELLENHLKPGAIILNCGAMSNKVLHVRLPSVLFGGYSDDMGVAVSQG